MSFSTDHLIFFAGELITLQDAMLRSANLSVAFVIKQTHIIEQILCVKGNINGISMHT